MKNRKAFTLIELMAVIIILGILLTIAVPNTLSMLDRNKKNAFVEDAKKFAALSNSLVQKDKKIERPNDDTSATLITLDYLNTTQIEKSPYAVNYIPEKSFVVIARQGGRYLYYVNLIACDDANCASGNVYGINVALESDLALDNARNLVRKGDVVTDYIDYNAQIGNYEAASHLKSRIGNRTINHLY